MSNTSSSENSWEQILRNYDVSLIPEGKKILIKQCDPETPDNLILIGNISPEITHQKIATWVANIGTFYSLIIYNTSGKNCITAILNVLNITMKNKFINSLQNFPYKPKCTLYVSPIDSYTSLIIGGHFNNISLSNITRDLKLYLSFAYCVKSYSEFNNKPSNTGYIIINFQNRCLCSRAWILLQQEYVRINFMKIIVDYYDSTGWISPSGVNHSTETNDENNTRKELNTFTNVGSNTTPTATNAGRKSMAEKRGVGLMEQVHTQLINTIDQTSTLGIIPSDSITKSYVSNEKDDSYPPVGEPRSEIDDEEMGIVKKRKKFHDKN